MNKINKQLNQLTIGIKLLLITKAKYHYEGSITKINLIENTITLKNVKFLGYDHHLLLRNHHHDHNDDPNHHKIPTIGTIYDSITFWISCIDQMWPLKENMKLDRKKLNDPMNTTTNTTNNNNKEKQKQQKNTLGYAPRDQKRLVEISSIKNKPTTGDFSVVNRSRDPSNQRTVHKPRMLNTYSRRSRNMRPLPKQRDYIPMFPIVPHPGNLHKFGYPPIVQNPPFRLMSISNPPKFGHLGLRYRNKRQSRPMRLSNSSYRQHIRSSVNPYGVYVYLPPEVATTMQQRSTNFMVHRFRGTRRRMLERKATRINPRVQSEEIDCTIPYDFETANAELEAELAKMSLNTDEDSVSRENSEVERTIGDRPIPSMATNNASRLPINSNNLSRESSSGAVSSTTANTTNVLISENKRPSESKETLSKGEYYVREKCFYDQISRSDGRPRSPTNLQSGWRKYKKSTNSHYNSGLSTRGRTSNSSGTIGGNSWTSLSKRERQLNFETFGPMATKRPFWRQRRSSSVPRDLFVSASA